MTLKTVLGAEMGRDIDRQPAPGGFHALIFSGLGGHVPHEQQGDDNGRGDEYGFDELVHARVV